MIYYYQSPLGWFELVTDENALLELQFVGSGDKAETKPQGYVQEVVQQLDQYFDGQRQDFELNLKPAGTDFQKSVWASLQTIPFGETVSYQDVAAQIDNSRASRAVGNANGKNPIAVIIPCHRVVAHSGKLGGYSSGLDKKRWLLRHAGHQHLG